MSRRMVFAVGTACLAAVTPLVACVAASSGAPAPAPAPPLAVSVLGDDSVSVNPNAHRQAIDARGLRTVAVSGAPRRQLQAGYRCETRRAGRSTEVVVASPINRNCRAEGLTELANLLRNNQAGDAVVVATGLEDARTAGAEIIRSRFDEARRLLGHRTLFVVTAAAPSPAVAGALATYNSTVAAWCAADMHCHLLAWDSTAAARKVSNYSTNRLTLTATGARARAQFIAGGVAGAMQPPVTTTSISTTTPTAPPPPTSTPDPDPGVITEPGERGRYTDGVGAFRLVCAYSHSNDDDPIVKPGQPGAAHHHAFFGNRSTNAFSTTESLMAGTTSCPGGTANRSAYWVPAMMTPNGEALPSEMIVYYKSGYFGVAPADVRPMPAGLRMVAGEPMRTEEDLRPSWERHTFWSCIRRPEGDVTPTTKEMQACPAGSDVMLTVHFPQCWDGVHLDSADHMSHMAYSFEGCPASHPVPIPVITLNVFWPVTSSTTGWSLASDHYTGPAGRSAHADWWNGWDPGTQAIWMRYCVNAGLDCAAYNLGDGRRLGPA